MHLRATRSWRICTHFLLRRAGFSFDVLEDFRCPQTAQRAMEVVQARTAAENARQRLLREFFAKEVERVASRGDKVALRMLSKWRSRVGRSLDGAVPDVASAEIREAHDRWRESAESVARAQQELRRAYPTELARAQESLHRFVAEAPVRMALLLMSPGVLDTVEAVHPDGKSTRQGTRTRALDRRLYCFAQRLAGKNETTSFFGPMTYGEVCDDVPADQSISLGRELPGGVTRRETFCAFWAAVALGQAASADEEICRSLPVRRMPAAAVGPGWARFPDGREAKLDAASEAVALAVDGERTVSDLAQVLETTVDSVEATVCELERRGFLQRDLEPRSTTAYPLQDVLAQLPPGAKAQWWRSSILRFDSAVRAFGHAQDLDDRRRRLAEAETLFTELTGKPARRAYGQVYADRSVLYEDCLGDQHPVRLSPRTASRLQDAISPVLDLGAAYGELRHAAVRRLARTVLDRLGTPVSFLVFARALHGAVQAGEIGPLLDPARALRQAVTDLVREASDGRVAKLAAEQLASIATPRGEARFASPDVLVAQNPGDNELRFVLGEIHPYVFGWGSQGHFAPDENALQSALARDLGPWGGSERIAVVLRRRKHKGLVTETFPGRYIEVTGRASFDRSRTIALADLQVVAAEDGPELHGPHGPLTLYVGEEDHPHLRAFAPPAVEMPPVRLGEHTPRIETGDLVWQRERWDLSADACTRLSEATDPPELAVAVADARVRLGWPRHLFALSPREPKPIYLDLEIPFAQEHLRRLATFGQLSLTEMCPAPNELWLHRSDGAYTSELRLALTQDP